MLSQQVPAIVVGGGDLFVGTFKEWNVAGVPIKVAIVPKCLRSQQFLFV